MKKSILDGYIGIKYHATQLSKNLLAESEKQIVYFKKNGKLLLEHNMAPANGGNMSMQFDQGFLITCSGCNLGYIDDDEISYVEHFSMEEKTVHYRGPRPPSSETFLHGLLYNYKKEILSVIHAHDEVATSMKLDGILDETEREEPYGTVELAQICLETFQKGSMIIVLKNHGYVAIGPELDHITETIIAMHNNLMHLKKEKDETSRQGS